MSAEKACTRCGDVKPLDEFARDRRRRDGRHPWCRECCRTAVRTRRAARRAAGQCREADCPNQPEPGRTMCAPCAEADAARDRARRAADKANGVCMWSGCRATVEPGRVLCAEHAEANAARHRALRAANAARTDEQIAADRARLRPDGMKRCRSCREVLPLDAFSDDRSRADGLSVDCRDCRSGDLLRAALPHIEETDCWTCAYCSAPIEHVDHIWPRALGGTDEPHNLIGACAECNSSKNATPVLDWLARRDPELVARVSSWSVEVVA
ncbi:HNH endonuclease [Streptomyces sp. enrichment culture]|uniref:HNH endonuclease n=1 Tax=Streptomyces sp. enrichment culture TaxID=1795815 RepID=UPI003F5716FC